MENVIEQASAVDIEMAKDFLKELDAEVSKMPTQQNGSESHGSTGCIYMVPKSLRNANLKANKSYDPQLISIGPLHRENKGLKAMENEKLKYFKKLTEQHGKDEKKICDIVIYIKSKEGSLRNCYPEKSILMNDDTDGPNKKSSDDFVKMILLDAVFIIQFFLESNDDTDGPKNFDPRMTLDIREDLLLLENQLPLFIIQEIYDRVYPRSQDVKPIPFLDLATCHFRKKSFLKRVETSPGVEEETSPGVKEETSQGVNGKRHFTDLLRKLMLSRVIKERNYTMLTVEESSSGVETNPGVDGKRHCTDLLRKLMFRGVGSTRVLKYSAVMLLKAGVRFEGPKDKCLVDITFDKGVLKIPQLEVDHNFERRIRNIMALEQCCYPSEAYICSYMKFMDHLIDTAADVGLLVRKGIIVHRLGKHADVSNMINHFCENIGDNNTCFGDISGRLNAHYDNRCNHRKETLKLVYFPNIWRGTATVAAAILLILTFIQAVCSVKSLS